MLWFNSRTYPQIGPPALSCPLLPAPMGTGYQPRNRIPAKTVLYYPYRNRKHDHTRGLRVLIVDDNRDDCELLEDTTAELEMWSETVNNATDAIQALKQADTHNPFDLILLDYRLPVTSGLAICRVLKHHSPLINRPKVILVSALARSHISTLPESKGLCDSIMTKPVTPKALKSTILRVCPTPVGKEKNWPRQRPHKVYASDSKQANAHILIAEDNPVNQRVIEALLKTKGIKSTLVNNGREAVNQVMGNPEGTFDLVLMDLDMPVMDGFEASRMIKTTPVHMSLPIIAFTSHTAQAIKQRSFQVGMDDFLSKPVSSEKLFDCIAATIKRYS